ncbi:MAG: NosD domain-containing protein [Candidatus Caldarchaeum sp.]
MTKEITTLILIVGFGVLSLAGAVPSKPLDQAQAYTVCPEGPPACTFTQIQDAINRVPEGATITIKAGTYEENLLIRKSLALQALEGEHVMVKSATASLPTLLVVSSRPMQVDVVGLTILPAQEHQGNGIEIMGTVAARIERNTIQGYQYGILVLGKAEGLSPSKLTVTIGENMIRDNSSGVVVWQSANVTISKNSLQDNKAPGGVGGIIMGHSHNIVVSGNRIQDNSGYGIGILQSEAIQIMSNLIKTNPLGIFVGGSQAELFGNQVEHNGIGVAAVADGPEDSRVSLIGNRIIHQENYGLAVERLDQVNICRQNDIRENRQGDYLVQSPLFSLQPRRDPKAEEELRKRCEG